jgi:osmotically-inducible protein OsmY
MKKTMVRLALIAAAASLFLTNVAFASETDDRIESSAKQSYVFRTYLRGDNIDIQSRNGAVTLTGTVSEESDKALAQETLAGLPGVTSVDNLLQVKGEIPAQYSNAWLIAKVESTLLYHRNVNAIGTEVLAKDGIITLRGQVENQAQKDLTTEYVKDVEGVRNVNNEMTVLTAQVAPPGKNIGEKMNAAGESVDDASVTALVKTTLMYHRSTSALKTIVETKDGVVTLRGKAKNAAEKDLATKFVSDVHGVKMVVNNMTVAEIQSKAD